MPFDPASTLTVPSDAPGLTMTNASASLPSTNVSDSSLLVTPIPFHKVGEHPRAQPDPTNDVRRALGRAYPGPPGLPRAVGAVAGGDRPRPHPDGERAQPHPHRRAHHDDDQPGVGLDLRRRVPQPGQRIPPPRIRAVPPAVI